MLPASAERCEGEDDHVLCKEQRGSRESRTALLPSQIAAKATIRSRAKDDMMFSMSQSRAAISSKGQVGQAQCIVQAMQTGLELESQSQSNVV